MLRKINEGRVVSDEGFEVVFHLGLPPEII
jgi:hypothetical protein